jgi:hypothetical protein
MDRIWSIISENNATFYNYRTGGRVRIWPRIILFLLASPAIALVVTDNLTDFVNSINTVTSILLGFGFSVLFYIASGNEDRALSEESLEKKNKLERINKLSKELFHNVSYFVMTASAGLAVAMIVIAPDAHGDWFATHAVPLLKRAVSDPLAYAWWVELFIRSLFFFLLIESAYTFARVVGRVNFLFEERLSKR